MAKADRENNAIIQKRTFVLRRAQETYNIKKKKKIKQKKKNFEKEI